MAPRSLALVLGLCNVVAGALLVSAPSLLLGSLEGSHTPSASLLRGCIGVLLVAIGVGALRMPPEALRSYLWIFGVAVKVVAAMLWSLTALQTGVDGLWIGAAADGALALVIAAGLWRPSADGDARRFHDAPGR
jgi:hypothetical protein